MGTLYIEYDSIIKPKLMKAIDNALDNEVKDVALSAIEFGAMHEIYMAYTPEQVFQESRRFSFLEDENYETNVENCTLTITSVTKDGLQDLFYRNGGSSSGVDLGDVVAKGASAFLQPFPRPWMEEGIQANIGRLESALKAGIERQGF